MAKFDFKLWGIRVRKVLVVALIAPIFTVVSAVVAPQMLPRSEAASIGSGICVQDVGSISGVTVTQSGNDCIVQFTSRTATTWKAPAGVTSVRYLVVGGGASGDRGTCGVYWGRGGGGGQVRDATLSVTSGTNYSVTVGKGGDARVASCPDVGGNNGVASQFGTIVASPGLGGETNTAKGGVSGFGLIGGVGAGATLGAGGGGGAGVAGSGKNGGAGVNSDIITTGSMIMYGSGGAGRDNNGTGTAASGGATGGAEAAANRGGGGADYSAGWYAGADGVVILRYTAYVPITFPQVAYNPTTLSVGAGVGGRSDTFTASGGSGSRTFSLTPVRSGFSIDTSTANGAALVVSSLVATGTYLETITVTDAAGFSVNHVVTVTVAAPVKWSVENPTSLTTTIGTASSSRLNITGGTTGRVVTLTKPTTVPLNGITIDTSTAISSNYVTLNVSTRVLPGTYSLTVSVIDSSRIRSNQAFTVNVNKLPALSFTNGTAETTTIVRSGLHLQHEFGQSYSGSGTTALDLSGNNRNGAVVANTPYSASLGGGSVTVNRANYLQVQPGVITDSDSISRFYWIYPRSATQTLITVCNAGCGYIESELELSNSRLFARVWDLTSVSTQETLTLNTWHYVGYIYEGSTKRTSIYINGQLSASAISTGTRGAPAGAQYELMGYNTTTNMQTGLQGDYSLASVHYYKRVLTEAEIFSNYAATAPRFLNTPFPGLSTSGSATIITTQGIASSHSLFSATEGTGGKVITLSSVTAGVTLDTSTANSAILNIANTVTATNSTTQRTISTSVVATDSVTATTTYPLTLRINPPVLISASIPLTLSTTFGRVAYDTFTATQGTGNKTFTGVSSAFPSAFTVSNPSANVGLLTVAATLPVGTYLETITATDSVGATTNYVLTVVVNPAPTIAGATGNTLTTTLSRSGSLRINVIGGTGTRTISWTSPDAGITIDSSTITSQNFITLNVSSNVPVRTYSFAISAIDSTSARVSDTFTVVVNRWPVIGPATSVSSNLRLSLDSGNASSYSGSGTGWNDLSGNSKNATWQVSPTYIREFDGAFSHTGATNQYATTPNLGTTDVFSVETWVRFDSLNRAGTPAGTGFPCVITDDFLLGVVGYSICFAGNNEIKGGYWRTAENKWAYTPGFTPVVGTWYHIVYTVSKSGSNYISTLYQNGNVVGSTTDAMVPGNSGGVNFIGKRWGTSATFPDYVNGLIPIVRVYSQALTRAEILQNYNAQGSRFISTNSGSETLTVTQGVAGSLSGVVASQGTGIKTLTLSNTNAGISIDTATANTFSLALANTLTATSTTVARTLTETVTATDTAGAATSRVYSVVVNPPVRVESTTSTITTTSGIVAWDTFTATQGTGLKTFTLTGTPSTTGFTLTQANSQAVLKVESTVNPGTYVLTITARDTLGAATTINKTVVVIPGPILIGSNSLITARGFVFRSLPYSVTNGIAPFTYTLASRAVNPSNSVTTGISFDSSTMTLRVADTVTAGTYVETLTVRDSKGATSSLVINLDVRPPAVLSGSLSITKNYGESSISNYTVSSATGVPPFTFTTSTPTVDNACAPITGTYIGNGTNGVLGRSYTYEKFTGFERCNWIAPTGVTSVDYVVVGGGAGGGNGRGGGGGGGGVAAGTGLSITPGTVYDIAVAQGGTATNDGNDSWIGNFGATSLFVKANGGGAGGSMSSDLAAITGNDGRSGAATVRSAGGSGGGGGNNFNNGTAHIGAGGAAGAATVSGNVGGNSYRCDPSPPGYSNNSDGATTGTGGRTTGGGGGAGGVGIGFSWSNSCPTYNSALAPNGGAGVTSLLTGSAEVYGGGGGGADGRSLTKPSSEDGYRSTGGGLGAGGGGNGEALRDSAGENLTPARLATSGTLNTGGGGGGGVSTAGSGGSGVVVVRYETPAVDSVTVQVNTVTNGSSVVDGSVVLSIPERTPAGSITTKLIRLYQNGTYTNYVINVTINKETPTAVLSLPGSVITAKYGTPVTVTAVASTAGRVGFKNGSTDITGCTEVVAVAGLATCEWTPTVVGAATIKAILTPTDTANYNSSSEATLAVTVAKADTLTVTVLSQSETFTGTTVPATSAFTTTGLAVIDSLTAISMLFTGAANDGNAYSSTTAPTNAGIYTIAPNYPTNASAFTFGVGSAGTTSAITNYESVTVVSGTLNIRRAPQTMVFTFANSNTVTYSPTATLASTATTRLGTGTRTYSSTTPVTCSISETAVVTVLEAGSCSVQMAVALTANYEADTATRVVTINKASRTFVLTPGVSTLKFADTTTVTATLSGGAADGTISYTLGSPAGCTFDPLSGELVAISGTIQCPLTATISEGINYLAETSTVMSLTIARANAPVISIDTVTAVNHIPNTRASIIPTFTITGLKNLDTANSLTYTYGFVSNPFENFSYSDTQTPIDAGTYSITPSALTLSSGLMSNYETPTYASSAINVVINRIAQETVTIQSVNGEVDVPFALYASGGSTTGTLSFARVSGDFCSVSGTTLTATQAGNCVVTVTRPGDRNYLPYTSASVTVSVRNFVIVQIVVPANPVTGITIAPSVPLVKGPDVCTSGCVPKITSADVYDVAEGDLIVLTGLSFNGVTKVYFNIYTEAPNFNVDSDTQISVRVPADLTQGDATIEVVSPGGTSNRLFDFIILP